MRLQIANALIKLGRDGEDAGMKGGEGFMTQKAVGSQNESLADASGRHLFTRRRELSALFFSLFFWGFLLRPPLFFPIVGTTQIEHRLKSWPAVSTEEKQQREGKAWHCCFMCHGEETDKQKTS